MSVAGLLVLAGSAAGQTSFGGTDNSGFPFEYTGIDSQFAANGGAGINDGSFGSQTDAFDGAFAVTVNGQTLSAPEFSSSSSGTLLSFTQNLGNDLSAGYTLAFKEDNARVRLDVVLINRGDAPSSFEVNVSNNLGSDGSTIIPLTSSGDLIFTTADRWVITDDSPTGGFGDPTTSLAFRGPSSGTLAPTSVSSTTPVGFISVTFDATIDPFDDRILSFFLDMEEGVSFANADLAAFDSEANVRANNLFSPNFFGRKGRELNFDRTVRWDGSTSDYFFEPTNWEFDVSPSSEALLIVNERDAFLLPGDRVFASSIEMQNSVLQMPEGSFFRADSRFKIDEDSEIHLDDATLDPSFLILNEGLIRSSSLGAEIRDNGGRVFPSLRNMGRLEVVGIPFSPEFASLDVDDDVLNLDQVILRGAAELSVNRVDNEANFDVVFANAVLNGGLANGGSGLVTVSGGSQFNQVGTMTNDGTVVVSPDSSFSLLGSLIGNGIEGPGGPGSAGAVFIRDGVSGRSGETGRIAFDGPLSIGSNAVTTIRLGGTTPGMDFDQIAVAGTFSAAGTIRFESSGGFVPQPGDAFDVLDFDAIQGAFASVEFDATLAGAGFDTSDLLIDGTIRVPSVCTADTNGDGLLSPADFNAWILAFNTNAPVCDQNGDGLCSPADFNAWILNFNAGCP